METDWKDYLASAEHALQQLDQDHFATIAKFMAFQLGIYHLKYSDSELDFYRDL